VQSAKNNYLKLKQPTNDDIIQTYNKNNILNFGEGNITTENNLKDADTLFTLPFAPSSYEFSKGKSWLANIPLVSFEDTEAYTYTSILDSSGFSAYQLTVTDLLLLSGEVVRILDDNFGNLGYFYVVAQSSGDAFINEIFKGSSTGVLYRQKAKFNKTTCRELIYKVNGTSGDVSSSTFYFYNETFSGLVPSNETLASPAFFTKKKTGISIDSFASNLSFDDVDENHFDPTFKELYFNKISKFLQNPNIRAKMLLPEAVYQSFVFDQFIYLKTEKLTGYFFVDSIVNYVDGNTPVEVNLYML
jgi:hypothetical protein